MFGGTELLLVTERLMFISKLREKLGDHFLKTIKGVGYKFIEPEN